MSFKLRELSETFRKLWIAKGSDNPPRSGESKRHKVHKIPSNPDLRVNPKLRKKGRMCLRYRILTKRRSRFVFSILLLTMTRPSNTWCPILRADIISIYTHSPLRNSSHQDLCWHPIWLLVSISLPTVVGRSKTTEWETWKDSIKEDQAGRKSGSAYPLGRGYRPDVGLRSGGKVDRLEDNI